MIVRTEAMTGLGTMAAGTGVETPQGVSFDTGVGRVHRMEIAEGFGGTKRTKAGGAGGTPPYFGELGGSSLGMCSSLSNGRNEARTPDAGKAEGESLGERTRATRGL